MKLKHVTVAAVCIGFSMTACQKDKQHSSAPQDQVKATDDIQTWINGNREASRQSTTVNPGVETTVTLQSGAKMTIPANSIRAADGSILTQNVVVSINENYNCWNMLSNNMPTETAADDPLTAGKPVISGGSYDIRMLTVSGASVTIPDASNIQLIVPGSLTGGYDADMIMWEGAQSPDQERDMLWAISQFPLGNSGSNYLMPNKRPWWRINVDKPTQLKSTTGSLIPTVILPTAYSSVNAEVFLLVDGEAHQLGSLDVYDASNNSWTDNVGYLDEGQAAHLVIVGIVNGTLHATITPFAATVNQTITIPNVPATTTAALRAAVMAL